MELEEMRVVAEAICNQDIQFGIKAKAKYFINPKIGWKFILVRDLVNIAFRAGISWERAHRKPEQLTFIKE